MNFQFYLEKLENSDIFKKFKKENPKAYLCSGFFTIDKVGNDSQRHLDFYVLKDKKMFNFKFEDKINLVQADYASDVVLKPLKEDIDFEIKEIEFLISKRMEKEKIKNKLQKILISLQNVKGKPVLICTVFVSGFGLLRVNIDISSSKPKIILFEKKSFFDVIRRVK